MKQHHLFAFRIGLASSLLGISILAYLFAFAQTGPSWEVPVTVMAQLRLLPRLTFGLGIIAVLAFFIGERFKAFSMSVWMSYITLLSVCFLASILVGILQPEQWPGRFPLLSRAAICLLVPLWITNTGLFWQIGFRKLSAVQTYKDI